MGKCDIRQRTLQARTVNAVDAKHPCSRWFPGRSCPFVKHLPGGGPCPLAEIAMNACQFHTRLGQCEYGDRCKNAHTTRRNGRKVDLHEYFLSQWKGVVHPCRFNNPEAPQCKHDPCLLTSFPATACTEYALQGTCSRPNCQFLHTDEHGIDLRARFLASRPVTHLCATLDRPCIPNSSGVCVLSAVRAQPVCRRYVLSGECDGCTFPHELAGVGDVRAWYVAQIRTTTHPCLVWFGSCKYGDSRCHFHDFPGDSCYREVLLAQGCCDEECRLTHTDHSTEKRLRRVYQERLGISEEAVAKAAHYVEVLDFSLPSTPSRTPRKSHNYPPYFDDVERRNKEVVDPCYEAPLTDAERGDAILDTWFAQRKSIIAKSTNAQDRINALNANSHEDDSDEVKQQRQQEVYRLIEVRQSTWARKQALDRFIRLHLLARGFKRIRRAFKEGKKTLPIDLHYYGGWYLCDVLKRLLMYSATLPGRNIQSLDLVVFTGCCRTVEAQKSYLFEKLKDILANDKWIHKFVEVGSVDKVNNKIDVRLRLRDLHKAYRIPSQTDGMRGEVSLESVVRKSV